jgi:hypothetical protein
VAGHGVEAWQSRAVEAVRADGVASSLLGGEEAEAAGGLVVEGARSTALQAVA